ncbi:hypothetical protein [Alkalibacillus haloalkaliphilus]|uniref:hypothetical protein n=1 Tax=Alkalibacillus haloalkaliphilus TaxID=94136 RepID=UPI0029365DB1|nr:hypothetical protein [Alkalibacillus haloalkaliphilus]MDV2582453.1 hypothetical protein [Alkalibacillus haloalkaliphilus]
MKRGIPILIVGLLLASCNVESKTEVSEVYTDQQQKIIGEEKSEMLAQTAAPYTNRELRDEQYSQDEVFLDYVHGDGETISLSPGRYEITGSVSGNINVYNDNNDLIFHDILGSDYGVGSITVDIDEDFTIHADAGFNAVMVTPAEEQQSNNLTAGHWEVGVDIEPGDYLISSSSRIGYLQIHSNNKDTQVYEVMGSEFGSTESEVTLEEGQILRITEISYIHFEPQ